MSKRIVIDTSVLVGFLNPQDHWHQNAVGQISKIQANPEAEMVLFDCVISETVSVICRRLNEKNRHAETPQFVKKFESRFPPNRITWILTESRRFYPAVLNLMQETSGRLNFNDSLIALACRASGISQIATFDRDFDLIPWLETVE